MEEDDKFYDVAEASVSGEHQNHVDEGNNIMNSSLIMDREQLEKCGQWLLSIPRDDVVALRKTPEYDDFLKSFDLLGLAHRRAYNSSSDSCDTSNENINSSDGIKNSGTHNHYHHSSSFLQHLAVDDVVLRVLEFLECHSLIPTSETCSRFRELATQSATQRTATFRRCRLLNTNVMKLLRATEEMEGSWHGAQEIIPSVPIPLLGLERRVAVTDAGDAEFNGIYYCTGSDGNGFVFTKPRNETSRASMSHAGSGVSGGRAAAAANRMMALPPILLQAMDVEQLMQPLHPSVSSHQQDGASVVSAGNLEEPARSGQLLRCFIAKRFSNETILWYMSKEVETISPETGLHEISQSFSYWCKLQGAGVSSLDLSRYPTQTSIVLNQGANGESEAWRPLSVTLLSDPPVLELLD